MALRPLLRGLCLIRPVITSAGKCTQVQRSLQLHPVTQHVQKVAGITTSSIQRRNDTCSFHVQNDEDFKKRVLENDKTMIVDFHATWCGPCKILGPTLEKKISEWKGDVMLAKVDIDSEDLEDTVHQYQVQVVPTVIAVKNGKVVDNFKGVIEEDQIVSFIERAVGHSPPE